MSSPKDSSTSWWVNRALADRSPTSRFEMNDAGDMEIVKTPAIDHSVRLDYPRLINVDGKLYLKAFIGGRDQESEPLSRSQVSSMAADMVLWLGSKDA